VGAVALFTIRVAGPDDQPQSAFAWLYQHTTMPLAGDNGVGSFLFAAGYMLVIWLVAWAAHKRGVIIKI
jgi:predicted acyltransferase